MFRQGDLLFVRVGELKTNGLKKSKEKILALGETTGHKHQVVGVADVFVKPETPFWGELISVIEEAIVKHEEHAPITLVPGIYKVIHQREWNVGDIRYVTD